MTTNDSITDWERDISCALGERFPGTTELESDRNSLKRNEFTPWVDQLRTVTTPVFDLPNLSSTNRRRWSGKVLAAAACLLIGIPVGLVVMKSTTRRPMPPPATDVSRHIPPSPPDSPVTPASLPRRTVESIINSVTAAPGDRLTRARLKSRSGRPWPRMGSPAPGVPPDIAKRRDALSKELGFDLRFPKTIPPKYAMKRIQLGSFDVSEFRAPAASMNYEGPHGPFVVLEFNYDARILKRGALNVDLGRLAVRTSDTHIVMVYAPSASQTVCEALATMMFPRMKIR